MSEILQINEKLKLTQIENSLCFGTDAYLLYAYLREAKKARAAEFGAGSGVISLLAAAKGKFSKIYAFEIQKEVYASLCQNVCNNALDGKISPINLDIRNINTDHTDGKEVDVVFFNPPYMKHGSGKESDFSLKAAARHELNGGIKDFTAAASAILKFGGAMYAVYRADRLCDLFDAMRSAQIEPKRLTVIYPDTEGAPTLVLCEGKKGASPSLFLTKPLLLYKDTKIESPVYTDDLLYIYENGDFDEQFKTKRKK